MVYKLTKDATPELLGRTSARDARCTWKRTARDIAESASMVARGGLDREPLPAAQAVPDRRPGRIQRNSSTRIGRRRCSGYDACIRHTAPGRSRAGRGPSRAGRRVQPCRRAGPSRVGHRTSRRRRQQLSQRCNAAPPTPPPSR